MCFCSIFIDVVLRVDCILGLGLGTVFVLVSTGTVVAVCNTILEKTAHCIASLTVPANGYC